MVSVNECVPTAQKKKEIDEERRGDKVSSYVIISYSFVKLVSRRSPN